MCGHRGVGGRQRCHWDTVSSCCCEEIMRSYPSLCARLFISLCSLLPCDYCCKWSLPWGNPSSKNCDWWNWVWYSIFFFNVRKKRKICACLWVWSTLKQMRKRHNCWALLIREHQNLTLIHTHLLQHTRTDLDLYICCFFHQSHSQPYCLFLHSNSWSQIDLSVSVMTLFTVSQTFPITLLCQIAWFPSKFQISLIYIEKMFGGDILDCWPRNPACSLANDWWLIRYEWFAMAS